MKTPIEIAAVETPAGEFRVAARSGALVAAAFAEELPRFLSRLESRFGPLEVRAGEDPAGAVSALLRYLAGETSALDAVPVDLDGTPFQGDVWAALRGIPAGSTITYAELARRVGRPRAVRAVGAANGANPVAVFVPCHRVVGKDGLRGYAGGVERKAWLLEHERRAPAA